MTQSEGSYSYRQVHFVWAHLEEFKALQENGGEAAKRLRIALDHEWDVVQTLPSICTCGQLFAQVPDASEASGSGATAGKAPSAVLADMERAYEALPMFSHTRTRLYLQKTLGMSEIAVRNMHGREFEQRHRRRIALETFQPGREYRPRRQDDWDVLDPYELMTDFLNLGELGFLARGSRSAA